MNNDWREYINDQLYLAHYGTKGQKWGVRRYQNSDGSYTAAGKARYYGADSAKENVKSAKANVKSARRAYNESFNKAYNKSENVFNHLTKRGRKDLDNAWTETQTKVHDLKAAKSAYKTAKKDFKSAVESGKRQAVKDYGKKYDDWADAAEKANKEYENVKTLRKNIGKTPLKRVIASAKNETKEAKAYNKAFEKWSQNQDKVDSMWLEVNDAYLKTGVNNLSRLINNAKYD